MAEVKIEKIRHFLKCLQISHSCTISTVCSVAYAPPAEEQFRWQLSCPPPLHHRRASHLPLAPLQPTVHTSWGQTHNTASGSYGVKRHELKTPISKLWLFPFLTSWVVISKLSPVQSPPVFISVPTRKYSLLEVNFLLTFWLLFLIISACPFVNSNICITIPVKTTLLYILENLGPKLIPFPYLLHLALDWCYLQPWSSFLFHL